MAAFPRGPEREPRRAAGVRDPLFARALALSDGETTVCLLNADLTMVQNEDIARVRAMIHAQRPDLPPQRIMIALTHTHSPGESSYMFGGQADDAWMKGLREAMVETAIQAVDDLRPADLRLGQIEAPYNFNRRAIDAHGRARNAFEYEPGVTEGVTDPTLTVLRLDREEDSIYWIHWTAHGVAIGPKNDLFSADYPGELLRRVEGAETDIQALYTNGAAGNIHPKWAMQADGSAAEKVGRLLAEKALTAAAQAEPVPTTALATARREVQFTNRADAALTATVELDCLAIGPIIVGFMPGEPYVEFQLAFRRALAPRPALFVGYANGWNGYIPTRESFAQGGYGVDFFPTDDPTYSRTQLPAGAGETLLDILLELARSCQAKAQTDMLEAT
jgi:hypothetical protein